MIGHFNQTHNSTALTLLNLNSSSLQGSSQLLLRVERRLFLFLSLTQWDSFVILGLQILPPLLLLMAKMVAMPLVFFKAQ